VQIIIKANRIVFMSEIKRADLKTGMQVRVVMKEDRRTGKLIEGIVKIF
jgi:uncharacterized repeat protein (TIGR03833 family)